MQQSLMIDATMAEQSIAPPRRSPTRALLTGLLAVAAVVAHARPAEELANIADLFARQLVRAVDLTLDCC